MSKTDEEVEKIIIHKAELMIKNKGLTNHIQEFLSECSIKFENIPVKIFKICAVDAMIYDVGTALDFTKKKGSVSDWTSYDKRKDILRKIFLEKK